MSLIAEFTIETPLLQEALDAVPDMVLHMEAIHRSPEQPLKAIISARGGDFQTFERNLGTDPTVKEYECLSEYKDRRLYRIIYTEEAEEAFTYPILAEHDSVILDTTGTNEGLEIRARFPTRDGLIAYRESCKKKDIPFQLHSLYSEEQVMNDGGVDNPYGVTDAQREALVHALEKGYFSIPRQTTLEEIADELEISTQSVSQRLRRGQENMFQAVLAN